MFTDSGKESQHCNTTAKCRDCRSCQCTRCNVDGWQDDVSCNWLLLYVILVCMLVLYVTPPAVCFATACRQLLFESCTDVWYKTSAKWLINSVYGVAMPMTVNILQMSCNTFVLSVSSKVRVCSRNVQCKWLQTCSGYVSSSSNALCHHDASNKALQQDNLLPSCDSSAYSVKIDVLQFWLRALQAIVAASWGYKLFVCTNP